MEEANEETPEETLKEIQYNEEDVLGQGAYAKVFRGTFHGREVAVKRVDVLHFTHIEREIDALIKSDKHVNVIRYFGTESNTKFHFLALEFCLASLYDHVQKKIPDITLTTEAILEQTTKGLDHLHSISIVHRDLKPHNILFCSGGKQLRAVISDFGLSKMIRPDHNSLSNGSGTVGTHGWMAPEVLMGASTSYPIDIFSLGCIIYYVVTNGSHPSVDFQLVMIKTPESRNLIAACLNYSPANRPSASAVLFHPFFWEKRYQLEFFCDVSDRFVGEGYKSSLSKRIQKNGANVITSNWIERLCDPMQQNVKLSNGIRRPYVCWSVRSLLRLIRNIRHHPRQLPQELLYLGNSKHELVLYFTSRFPDLLMHVYEAMEWCSDEMPFEEYYSKDVRTQMGEIRDHTMEIIEDVDPDTKEEPSEPSAEHSHPLREYVNGTVNQWGGGKRRRPNPERIVVQRNSSGDRGTEDDESMQAVDHLEKTSESSGTSDELSIEEETEDDEWNDSDEENRKPATRKLSRFVSVGFLRFESMNGSEDEGSNEFGTVTLGNSENEKEQREQRRKQDTYVTIRLVMEMGDYHANEITLEEVRDEIFGIVGADKYWKPSLTIVFKCFIAAAFRKFGHVLSYCLLKKEEEKDEKGREDILKGITQSCLKIIEEGQCNYTSKIWKFAAEVLINAHLPSEGLFEGAHPSLADFKDVFLNAAKDTRKPYSLFVSVLKRLAEMHYERGRDGYKEVMSRVLNDDCKTIIEHMNEEKLNNALMKTKLAFAENLHVLMRQGE